jgi:hypothetical protein
MKTTQCAVDGCERVDVHARGLCVMHYARQKVRGTTDPLVMPSPAQRLAAGLVRMPNGCLEWTGATDPKGYGRITADGKTVLTHRLAWGLAHPDEPLPPVVRHFVCDNPPCCDPAHLRPGTEAENNADMRSKGRDRNGAYQRAKTHCKNRHPFNEANTYLRPNGARACRACKRTQITTPTEEQS